MNQSQGVRAGTHSITWKRASLILLAAAWLLGISAPIAPAEDAPAAGLDDDTAASVSIAEALYQEIYARNDERQQGLEAALALDPQSPAVRGLLGELHTENGWHTPHAPQLPAEYLEQVAAYNERRAASVDTAESQAELARWCRRQGLADRERVHWQRVLVLDPTSEPALTRLGLIRTDEGTLVTREELAAQRQLRLDLQQADRHWRPLLAARRRALLEGTAEEKAAALVALHEIHEPLALPTLEDVLSREGGELALVAVEILADMRHPWATESLLRHAILSEDEAVRTAAIEQLSTRSLYEFVPGLLDALQPPLEAEFTVNIDAAGNVNLRRWMRYETREGSYTSTFDQALYQFNHVAERVRIVTKHPNGQFTEQYRDNRAARAAAQSQIDYQAALTAGGQRQIVAAAEAEVTAHNERIESENARIIAVLAAATGENELATPLEWWAWWNEYNVVEATERSEHEQYAWQHSAHDYAPIAAEFRDLSEIEEPVRPGQYATIHFVMSSPTGRFADPYASPGEREQVWVSTWAWDPRVQRFRLSHKGRFISCFAAGTPVWTETGPRPIEEILPGDRVLTQDVTSGELLYKPVSECTVRQPTEVIGVDVEGETIVASGGHPFWVNGAGWRMVRQLESGNVLHGIRGGLLVSEIVPQEEPQAVYNLVVEDHHNYFVGASQILVHDVTLHEPTQAIVPGLVESD